MSREIIDRLNELLECERAGVEVARRLAASEARGFTEGELRKFAEDEGSACLGLREAIQRFGGTPSERTGNFADKVMALGTEGERVSLLARGQTWVVRRIEALLANELDEETRTFLLQMRDEHLENIEPCLNRTEGPFI
jgi:nitronate monooxygenase